ncbi:MAG TPA: hypothetical protein VLZ83_11790 [Edaphocola sp.]|nr:hypothetical protein [Edaphocola sp.]
MKNLGYILNFSTNYNANNYLYYFLPAISSGKILLFDQLTRKQLPTSKRHKEAVLKEKIIQLKNHWDLYRLNPKNKYENLRINIVLDYDSWDFTGFGKYAAFTFSKIYYLKKEFEKQFNDYDLSKIVFQYFVIKNKAEELEELIQFLDEKNAINDSKGQIEYGQVKRDLIAWPLWDTIEDCINEKFDIEGKRMEESISEKEQVQINSWQNKIEHLLLSGFGLETDNYFSDFLNGCINEFKTDIASRLLKIGDLNIMNNRKDQLLKLFKKCSSEYYLRKQDVLFRFTIDAQTNNSKIDSYESLTAFLAESIDFYDQENPLNFLTNGSNNQTINITDIQFDEEKKSLLFGRYQSFYLQVKNNGELIKDNKRKVKQYKFNSEIDPKQFFEIDENQQADFLTVKGLKHRYLHLFAKKNAFQIRKELEENTIKPLEDYIKTQGHLISQSYNLEGNLGLSESDENMNYREIEVALENMNHQEKGFEISSSTQSKKYESAVKKFNTAIGGLINDFMEEMKKIPDPRDMHVFFPLVLILVLLLSMPLYTFIHWFEAFFYSIVFILLISLTAVVIWYLEKMDVNSKFENIYLENVELLSRFQDQVNELSNISVNVRKSSLRRKNIKELQLAKASLDEEQRKYFLYSKFYEEIVNQIRMNGHNISDISMNMKADWSVPPIQDIRNRISDEESYLEILAGSTSKKYEKVKSQLGVIKSIKSR